MLNGRICMMKFRITHRLRRNDAKSASSSLRGGRHCDHEVRSGMQEADRFGSVIASCLAMTQSVRSKTSLRGGRHCDHEVRSGKQEADTTKNRFGFGIASCLAMTQSVRSKTSLPQSGVFT